MCTFRRSYDIDFFFFFQAEDGIRDTSVTGVQTCALPIFIFVNVGTAGTVMKVGSDDLPSIIDSRKGGRHSLGKWRIDGRVIAVFPDKSMKPLQSFPKTVSPVLAHHEAKIVDTQSHGTVGTRKIENGEIAVPIAYES